MTVANLAVAFARVERRVIVVDFDVRDPSLHRFFGLREGPGLLDVKVGDASLGEALQLVSVGGGDVAHTASPQRAARHGATLEVLSAGTRLHDPDQLGPGLPIESLIRELRDRADIVLVDAPGLLSLGDSIALTAYVDAMLVVVRLDFMRAAALDELWRVTSTCRAERLGLVVTGATKARRSRRRRSQRATAQERHPPVLVQPSGQSPGEPQPAATGDVQRLTARGAQNE